MDDIAELPQAEVWRPACRATLPYPDADLHRLDLGDERSLDRHVIEQLENVFVH